MSRAALVLCWCSWLLPWCGEDVDHVWKTHGVVGSLCKCVGVRGGAQHFRSCSHDSRSRVRVCVCGCMDCGARV